LMIRYGSVPRRSFWSEGHLQRTAGASKLV
jgi:hypothetical protein